LHVQIAAIAAVPTVLRMDDRFYSRATGKLKKGVHSSFSDGYEKKKATSTIYTLGDEDDNTQQHPMGTLSVSQKRFIESFLQGITFRDNVTVDVNNRAIHWIGMWMSTDKSTIVSCSLLQPHITNALVHLSNISENRILKHIQSNFSTNEYGTPKVSTPKVNPQLNGRFSVPLADSLVESCLIKPEFISWSLILLSESQPIFIISNEKGIYECRLTHASCAIMAENPPENVGIIGPRTSVKSYSFRSRDIVSGAGTGPAITVHKSGTFQYQGKPDSAYTVGRCFRESIEKCMQSSDATKFIKSLAVLRDTMSGSLHVS